MLTETYGYRCMEYAVADFYPSNFAQLPIVEFLKLIYFRLSQIANVQTHMHALVCN